MAHIHLLALVLSCGRADVDGLSRGHAWVRSHPFTITAMCEFNVGLEPYERLGARDRPVASGGASDMNLAVGLDVIEGYAHHELKTDEDRVPVGGEAGVAGAQDADHVDPEGRAEAALGQGLAGQRRPLGHLEDHQPLFEGELIGLRGLGEGYRVVQAQQIELRGGALHQQDVARFERKRLQLGSPHPVAAFSFGSAAANRSVHEQLRRRGLLVPYAEYIGAGAGGVVRAVVFSDHTDQHIDRLLAALAELLSDVRKDPE